MEILTLLKANMKRKKGAFAGICILMILIVLSASVILSVTENMSSSLSTSLEHAQIGDLVTFPPDYCVNDELIRNIEQNEYVDHIKDEDCITIMDSKINGKDQKDFIQLFNYADLTFSYHVFSEDGRSYQNQIDEPKQGEIYVPYTFQYIYKCKIGSNVVITLKDRELTLTIKGFFEEPLSGAYVITTKTALINQQDYQLLNSQLDNEQTDSELHLLKYHQLHIYQKQDVTISDKEFKQSLNEDSKVINYSYGTLSKADSEEYTLMLPKIFGNMLLVFVFLLFGIILIVMGNSISTGIEMEYVNLGVLKALGFSKEKLRLVLLLEYLLAEGVGAIFGLLIAIPCIKPLGSIFQMITGILASGHMSLWKCILIIIGILMISAVVIYLKTAKVVEISPVRAISGGKDPVYFDKVGTVKIKKKGMHVRMALRQLGSNRKQYIGIVLIVSILTYFLMSITILTKGIRVEDVYEVFGGITSDIKLGLSKEYKNDQTQNILDDIEQITPVTYSVFMNAQYLTVDGNQYNATIYDDPSQFRSITKGSAPLYENEIIITKLVSDMLHKEIGDTVTIGYRDKEQEYMISGIYQSSVEVGKCFGISLAGARRIEDIEPAAGYIRISDHSKINEVIKMCNDKYEGLITAENANNTNNLNNLIRLSLNVVSVWIYTITILFVLVVITMSCKKTFLKERQDIGIYKALGYTVKQLRLEFALRFLLVSVLGSIIGIILTLLLNNQMMLFLFRYIGITSYTSKLTPVVILLPCITMCVCFFGFSYLLARQVKKVAVRELVTE